MQEFNEQPEDQLVGPKVIAWGCGGIVVGPFVLYGIFRAACYVVSLL